MTRRIRFPDRVSGHFRGIVATLALRSQTLLLPIVCLVSASASAPAYAADDFRAVVMNGLPGNAEYASEHETAAAAIAAGLATLTDDPDAVVRLGPDAGAAELLAAIDAAAGAERFVLVLLGHGTAGRDGWQFNVKGPDIDEEALTLALDAHTDSEQLVVLAASASGAATDTLAQPHRSVLTATRSGREYNAVRFPHFFAEAFGNETADLDRDEMLSLAEAFRYASERVAADHEDSGFLQSEHAVLESDNAGRWILAHLGRLQGVNIDADLLALLDRRQAMHAEFRELLATRDERDIDEYYASLEAILVEMARLQVDIDARTGEGDDGES